MDELTLILTTVGIMATAVMLILVFKWLVGKIAAWSILVYSMIFGFSYKDLIIDIIDAFSTGNWTSLVENLNLDPVPNFEQKLFYGNFFEGLFGLILWGFIAVIAFTYFVRGALRYFFKDKNTPKKIYFPIGIFIGLEAFVISMGAGFPLISSAIGFGAWVLPILIVGCGIGIMYAGIYINNKLFEKYESFKIVKKDKPVHKKNEKTYIPIEEDVNDDHIITVLPNKNKKYCEAD